MFDHALDYIQKGFATFPLFGIKEINLDSRDYLCCSCGDPTCKDSGKHPATRNGLLAATTDESTLRTIWGNRRHLNVGIATGAVSGVFVVDIDGIEGMESIRSLEATHGRLPTTYRVSTPRGGFHLYFKYPEKKVISVNGKWKNVDVKGEGGYVVAPPSLHIRGKRYFIADEDKGLPIAEAPQWLLDEVCSVRTAPKVRNDILDKSETISWSDEEVIRMLNVLDPNCNRQDWLEIGMALQDGGYSFELFDSWSSGSATKYSPNDCAKTWMSFKPAGGITMGTLVAKAKLNGWKPLDYIEEDETVDLENHPARTFLENIGVIKKPVDKKKKAEPEVFSESTVNPSNILVKGRYKSFLPFNPEDLTNDHLLVSETVRWLTATSTTPQPDLAFLATLACLGALFGRRYACEIYNTRTNIMIGGLCSTATGKDHARKQLKNLMVDAGFERYLGDDDIKSDTGLLTMLFRKPSCVCFLDELGLLLKGINNDNAASYKSGIVKTILTAYSSSSSNMIPSTYADKKLKNEILHQPNLCIYGVATMSSYAEAMKKDAIETGELNRYILIPGREHPDVLKRPKSSGIDGELLNKWVSLLDVPNIGNVEELNLAMVSNPNPIQVRIGKVEEMLDALAITQYKMRDEYFTSGLAGLWGRYRENAMKIAMILAIARDPETPILKPIDISIAEKTVRASIEFMIETANNYMYDSVSERDKRALFVYIRENTEDNVGVSKAMIMKRFPALNGKTINSILTDLIDSDSIEALPRKIRGRVTVMYKSIEE